MEFGAAKIKQSKIFIKRHLMSCLGNEKIGIVTAFIALIGYLSNLLTGMKYNILRAIASLDLIVVLLRPTMMQKFTEFTI